MYRVLIRKLKKVTIGPRVNLKFERLKPYLNGQTIIDIGCGNGGFSLKLSNEGYKVSSLDVQNKSAFDEVVPQLFNGKSLPFENQSFDTALLITVLHHTLSQKELISEALRVAKQVVIMEDVYNNSLQRQLTFWMDSLVNWEWQGHPHSNKSHKEWMVYFEQFDCEIDFVQSKSTLMFFRQNVYVLKNK